MCGRSCISPSNPAEWGPGGPLARPRVAFDPVFGPLNRVQPRLRGAQPWSDRADLGKSGKTPLECGAKRHVQCEMTRFEAVFRSFRGRMQPGVPPEGGGFADLQPGVPG